MDQFLSVSSRLFGIAAILSLAYPLIRCWRRQRRASLRHAVLWFAAAWLGWFMAFLIPSFELPPAPWRYLALCLTAGALVAVLGARQPGMGAWNFVVAGLLAILSLPLVEQPWSSPQWRLDEPRTLFLAGILAVGIVNYLPTRWVLVAAAGGLWAGTELWHLVQAPEAGPSIVMAILFAALVWSACDRKPEAAGEFDALWLAFRDSYGLVWGLRVEEQFNHAAQHARLPVRLKWNGMVTLTDAAIDEHVRQEALRTLEAVLKRFVTSSAG
jgi:hypothetical protein